MSLYDDGRDPREREAGIRRLAGIQQARFPWRGDAFTFRQVLFLFEIIDELRAEKDARMSLFNTAAEIAGAAIADLQRDLANARAELVWLQEQQP